MVSKGAMFCLFIHAASAVVIQQGIRVLENDSFKTEELTQEKFDKDQRTIFIINEDGKVIQKHLVVQAPNEPIDLLQYIYKLRLDDTNEISESIRALAKFELRQFALGKESRSIFQSNDGTQTTIQLPFSARIFYERVFFGKKLSGTIAIHGIIKVNQSDFYVDERTISYSKCEWGMYAFIIGGTNYKEIKTAVRNMAVPAIKEKFESYIVDAALG